MTMNLDPEALNTCVGCGLCLPHCPTFRVTGSEAHSPRGRIDAMRSVESGNHPIDDDFVDFMSTCVQCRGCEPACPSGVPFGHLMEDTRAHLAETGKLTPWWQRQAYNMLSHHRLVLAGSRAAAVAQRVGLLPASLPVSTLPIRGGRRVASTSEPTTTDTWLFTGCVMDAWMRATHRATANVLDALGTTYAVPDSGASCCGALHIHAGLNDETQAMATRVMASMPGDAPILINSAGCGATMKEYGHLLGTSDAKRFSERVFDIHEWVAPRLDKLEPLQRLERRVIIQDPCHLRHVQGAHLPVRDIISRFADIVELDDLGLCCGAGGAFSALNPELAAEIRDRKFAAIDRARNGDEPMILASANPGCSMHLDKALNGRPIEVAHPIDLLAKAL